MKQIGADLQLDDLTEEQFIEEIRNADRWLMSADISSMQMELYVWTGETRKTYSEPLVNFMEDPQSFLVKIGKTMYDIKEFRR